MNFNAPTASLTVITNGGDTVNITGFDPAFNTPLLSLQGTTSANTYNLGAANIIPNATSLSLTGNADFNLNGFSETIGSLASTDATPTITLSARQTLTAGNASNTTYSGTLTGSGNLTKAGTGTLILSGASPAYTGTNTVNAGVLQITQGNSAGIGPTLINAGVFEINNVTHDGVVALNNGGTLRGLGAAARENGVITVAAGGAVTLAATAGSTLTLSDFTDEILGGAGTNINVTGGGVVALTQNTTLGVAATPVRWTVDGNMLSFAADLNFGVVPSAVTANFFTFLNNGGIRNVSTGAPTLATNRGITLGTGGGMIENATGALNLTYAGRFTGANPLNVTGAIGPAFIMNGPTAANQFSQLNINGTRLFINTNVTGVGGAGSTTPINIITGQFGLLSNSAVVTLSNPITMASGTTMVSRATGANSLQLTGLVTLPTTGTIIFNTEGTANGLINMTNATNAVALTGTLTVQVGPNTAGPGQVNLNHLISGTGGITKTGTGVVQIMNGGNTYAGSTTVTQGTMLLGTNNALPTTTALTVGTGTTVGTLNLQTFDQKVGSLSSTSNAAGFNVITVDVGRTLTVNGNVILSNNTDGAQTNMNINGVGSLVATGTNFFVGNNTTAATSKARLDLSALAAVNVTMTGAITVQADGDNGTADFAILTLSNTANTLIAPTLTVGASSTGALNQLILGNGTNVIRANTFNIGTGGRDAGSVTFASPTLGTVSVRNQAGTGAANFNMGTGTATTGITAANVFDVTGHSADLLLGTVNIGTQPRSFNWSSTFSFDTGTLTMNSLTLGTTTQTAESGNGTGIARITNATMNLGGGTVTINNGITNMASVTGTAYTDAAKPHTVNSTLNVTGGTVNIGATNGTSITMATLNVTGTTNVAALASNATINVSGGVLNVAGDIVRGTVAGTSTGGITATPRSIRRAA